MKYLTILITFLTVTVSAQDYSWSGAENDTDFFNEGNWVNTATGATPPQNAIDSDQNINFSLQLTCDVIASGTIKFGEEGSLSIENGTLTALKISGGTVTIGENSYVTLTDSIPLTNNPSINFISPISWLKALAVIPAVFNSTYLGFISTNGSAANYPSNIRLDNYYSQGTIVRPNDLTATPLSIYSQSSLQGTASFVTIDQIHRGTSIPGSLNNNIQSFLLKKGYMAAMSVNEDGTGKSKVFIASESDLVVNTMPNLLGNNTSFIRVIPWNWVAKKGIAGQKTGLDETWYYLWGSNGISDLQREYATMAWGKGGTDDEVIESNILKYKVTHQMGFNEADNCNGQSGQYWDLCTPSTAVGYYKKLMKTGLRLVSPSGTESAWKNWLPEFNELCVQQDVRREVIQRILRMQILLMYLNGFKIT